MHRNSYTLGVTETVSHKNGSQGLQITRSLWHLAAVIAITIWGFTAWPMPQLLGFIAGFGALIFTVLLWALFLSPKPMLRADRFASSMIELLLIAAAVAALMQLGVHWVIAAAFGLIGVIIGYIAGITSQAE